MRSVVGFLKADDSVESMVSEFFVVFSRQGHHLNLDVGEILLGNVDGLGKVRNSGFGWVLACDEQNVFEGCQLFDGSIFVFNLFGGEDGARHRVFAMEAAIDARVGTRVGDIKRNEHRHGFAKPLFCVFS